MIINARINPKISGDNTQNQDQVMKPVSFKTMNTMVNKPVNPIPLDELLELLITVVFK
jgi:hypothetical protein